MSYEEVNLDRRRYLLRFCWRSSCYIHKLPPIKEEPVEPTATPYVLQSLDDQALKSIIYVGQDGEVVQLDKMDTLTWTGLQPSGWRRDGRAMLRR